MRRGGAGIVAALVAALAATLAGGATAASAEVVWLCQPGMAENPCRDSLESTIYSPDGSSRTENPPLPADPKVDCFYVYPTVSEQRTRNANKDVDRSLVAIARYQASRYSQMCRVFAPVYRQQTLFSLARGRSPEALRIAYGDVEEAWREYLARHNRGRGVVLLGHSQGTFMLRALARRQIDPRPEVRRRIVSGLLLGGNVMVRAGGDAGGDFQRLPLCRRERQTGCIVAWSTYNDDPPPNSRFGRAPAEDSTGLGLPAGPGYEVACTNPASLAANRREVLTTFLRSEPYPGVIGALLIQTYGGPPPSAPTPWLRPRDHYSGRCETRNGANVLFVEEEAGARRLNPAPEPSWGLHLTDANIALGDLVALADRQAKAWLAGVRPRGAPRLELRTTFWRGPRRCARGNVRLRVYGTDLRDVRRVEFRIGGRVVARDGTAPFAKTVRRARFRSGRVHRVRAIAAMRDGREGRVERAVRACRR